MADQPQFIDAENFRNSEELSFKMIVLEHTRRIITLASQEMREGYMSQVQVGANNWQPVYVPSTLQAFVNAVDILETIVYPRMDREHKTISRSFRNREMSIRNQAILAAEEQGQPSRWQELYHVNMVAEGQRKFRWLSVFLDEQNYFEAGEMHEEI